MRHLGNKVKKSQLDTTKKYFCFCKSAKGWVTIQYCKVWKDSSNMPVDITQCVDFFEVLEKPHES